MTGFQGNVIRARRFARREGSQHGFSIMELIVAFCLIVIGFFTFFQVFSTGSQHAIQTQNRAAANMLAQSYMDDFRGHTFGAPKPPLWDEPIDKPVRMILKDRETEFVFHKKIEYQTRAFIGETNGDRDKVTLTITWKELAGSNQALGAPTGFPQDNKMLRVEMPVWR